MFRKIRINPSHTPTSGIISMPNIIPIMEPTAPYMLPLKDNAKSPIHRSNIIHTVSGTAIAVMRKPPTKSL